MIGLDRYRMLPWAVLIALFANAAVPASAPADEAADLPASTSASELQAAIDAIKRRVAAQQEARGTTGVSELAAELRSARESIADLTQSLVQVRAERDAALADVAAGEERREGLESELAARQQRLDALEAAMAETRTDAASAKAALESERAERQQRIAELEAEIDRERSASAALAGELEAARGAASEGQTALDVVRAERDALEGRLTTLEERLDEAEAARRVAEEDLARAETARQESDRQVAALQAADREAATAAAATIAEQEQEVADLREVASRSVREVEELGETLLEALTENEELATALAEARRRHELVASEFDAMRRDLDAATAAAAVQEDSLSMPLRPVPMEGLPASLVASDVIAEEPDIEVLSAREQPDSVFEVEPGSAAPSTPDQSAAQYLSQLNAVYTGDGWWMTVPEGLAFAPGSDALAEGAAPVVGQLAALLGYFEEAPVRVVGHTDSAGDAEQNRRLSWERAAAVGRLLVEAHGIDADRLSIEGFGADQPIASNDTNEGRQANRRVEVYVRRNN